MSTMATLITTAQEMRQYQETQEAARREERVRLIEAGKAADLADLRALLGGVADEAEIELHSSRVYADSVEVDDTSYAIQPAMWRGLAYFSARRWTRGDPWRFEYYTVSGAFRKLEFDDTPGNVWTRPEVIEMIADLQAAYERERDARIAEARESLSWAVDLDIYASSLATLMRYAPEREAEWQALADAAVERRIEREAAVDAYVQTLTAWRARYEKTLAENRVTVAGAQRALDEEFIRYEVAYAAVGDEPYRETAWAIDPDPEEGGWWSIFDNGNVVRRRLLRPLWVGEVVTQKLSEAGAGPWRRSYYVHDAGVTVYYLPWGVAELRQLDKTVMPLPAEPEPPAWVRDGLTDGEWERINEVTRGMARVDIPF